MKPLLNLSSGWLMESPLGPIGVSFSEQGLVKVLWGEAYTPGAEHSSHPRVKQAIDQLDAYFKGQLHQFDLCIDWQTMTPFQQDALKACYAIPYGQVRTYRDLALAIGKTSAASRAVGNAMAFNPMPLIIPCHRVLGSNGSLHGYGGPGGLATKAWLLRLEGFTLVA